VELVAVAGNEVAEEGRLLLLPIGLLLLLLLLLEVRQEAMVVMPNQPELFASGHFSNRSSSKT
jgi:hypothetical protein